jgi:large subunit ribosomal protein L13
LKQEKITKFIKTIDAAQKWYIVDAKDQVLGRLASRVAKIIRGKHKPYFTPNTDTGDFVVIINAEQIKITGKREFLKNYVHHSGYPGGLKSKNVVEVLSKNPEFIVENAVKGMLPKNRLGNRLIKKLKVYKGNVHPHSAQKPEVLNITEI